jgi:hypothetical protein
MMLVLQQRAYPNADCLNHRNHVHKAALTPFLNAVAKVLAAAEFARPMIRLTEDANPPTVHVQFDMRNAGAKLTEPLFASPDQPLNFLIRKDAKGRQVHDFEEELRAIARERGVDEISRFIEAEANTRNRILYASDQGVPSVEVPDGFFIERRRRVTVLLMLTIAIHQTAAHQLFAVQCLQALLSILPRIKPNAFTFDDDEKPRNLSVTVIKDADADPVAMITQHWAVSLPMSFTWRYGIGAEDLLNDAVL